MAQDVVVRVFLYSLQGLQRAWRSHYPAK